jgi:hypothetical protein
MIAKPFTGTIFQRIKLYIEGVEVPFLSISISSGIGGLPEANIVIPVQAGLMDISRFYSPKVHVFFTDRTSDSDDDKSADKLLFSGLISQVNYHKSKDGTGYAGIGFRCVHRYHLMNEMIIDYTGWLNADPMNPNPNEAPIKADTANSAATVIEALAGIKDPRRGGGSEITKDNPEGQTNILPERYQKYYNRLLGMPGVMVNFWNQMKRSAYNRTLKQGNKYYSEPFVELNQPLTEDGLKFFDRLGGHWPLEALVQADNNRVDPCPETPGKKESIVIPPSRQLFLASSIQAQMTVANVNTFLQNTGEQTTIYGIFSNFYESIDYEIVTLTSPAETVIHGEVDMTNEEATEFEAATGTPKIDRDKTHALDTIVKPKMPFYFSPTCNVLFPSMYSKINVMYDEMSIPTRINLRNLEGPNENGFRTNFRAPHSVREAIAKKVAGVNGNGGYDQSQAYSLLATLGASYGAIGHYEQGRGIRQESSHFPRWLSHFSQSTLGGSQPVRDVPPDSSSEANRYDALQQLAAGWAKRYPGNQIATLNPYSVELADISAHHRMLFVAADYSYTHLFARSKAGSVDCPFNPFIVPGYPMDILESNPTYPSFHALCTSVTHNFTAESASTTVHFTAAMTYSEMANYYIPFVSPMIQVALGLATNPSLIYPDDTARKIADDFYKYTLGTPAVSPDEIMDFTTMVVKPKKWTESKWTEGHDVSLPATNGGDYNPMMSYEGNLSLVYRNIEDRAKIEERFGLKFIDMSPANYGPTMFKYRDKQLEDETKFEIGRSQYLTYDTYFGKPVEKQTHERFVEKTDRGGNITEVVDLQKGITPVQRRGQ